MFRNPRFDDFDGDLRLPKRPAENNLVSDRRTFSASFSSLLAVCPKRVVYASKIEKKLPFGRTGNRNL
jgi:hypothetical protein